MLTTRWTGLSLAAGLLLLYGGASAQEKIARKDGLYINVPNALKDSDVAKIKTRIADSLNKDGRKDIDTIIFDFNPNGLPNSTAEFGACNALRKEIGKVRSGGHGRQIKAVAFVSNEVSKHSVLPVLACSELVMANDPDNKRVGSIGDVLRGQGALDEDERTAYEQVAKSVGARALVFRMIEPDTEIRQVKLADGSTVYLTRDEIKQRKAAGESLEDVGPSGLEIGSAKYDVETARKFGLCRAVYNDPAQIVRAYRLPRSVLTEVWLGDRPVVTGIIEVQGTLDKGKIQSLARRIDRARHKANVLILQLDCVAGNTAEAFELALKLASLKDDTGEFPVRTIAYVPKGRKVGAATFLALGCGEIVMGSDSVLGDFEYLKGNNDDDHANLRRNLAELAQKQGYPPAVFEAMLDRKAVLIQVTSRLDPNDSQIVHEKDWLADKKSANPKWQGGRRVNETEGEYFKLTAATAHDLGIVQHADVNTTDDLQRAYHLERVTVFRDDWLDAAAEFFREPLVKLLLIMVGIVGMILELKMPGTALPGIVSAICFVLFFWAHSFIGEYTMLAVLLFVLGLILLGLEVFVFPGFGLPGVAGILLVIGSLVLVTLERMPTTTQDWISVGFTLTTFGVGLAGAIAAAFMLAWYLPHIPYANRLVLAPPADAPGVDSPLENPLAGLLGAIGVAETPLRPAGKARFGEDFHDVIAEGDFVNPGSRVQVIEIEGQRIVVKEV
jgi:membrane-bound serine protease (ClpP class)